MIKPRTVDEFKAQVSSMKIQYWAFRKCSLCFQNLCYVFNFNGEVGLDTNCNCTRYSTSIVLSSWEALADCYNRNARKEDVFYWGFDS